MRRMKTIFMVLILAAGTLLPVAAANWKFRGTNEPDTVYDAEDGFMFTEPDVDSDTAVRKVYFNGFVHVAQVWINPNSASLGSRHQAGPELSLSALLGVWKDCNGDGFIGYGDHGFFEYRATLLTDTSICEPVIVNPASPPSPYPHNDGSWVREFTWMGQGPGNPSVNPTVESVASKVWFDWNVPGAPPRVTCPTTGAMSARSTGAFVEWIDCLTGYRTIRTLNDVEAATGAPVGGWDLSDPENSENDLNVENPAWDTLYGEDEDGFGEGALGRDHRPSGSRADRAVTVWDCTDNENPQVDQTPEVNAEGSVYEPTNETYNIVTRGSCKQSGSGESVNDAPWPNLDGQTEPQTADVGKETADDHFIFTRGNRRNVQGGAGHLGPFAPADGGLALERDLDAVGPSWRSNRMWGSDPQLISRGSLEPTPATYLTFYASVASGNYVLPPAAAVGGTYGHEACKGFTDGKHGGWKCNADAWTDRCIRDDTDAARCVTVGQSYQLRDVDCWDGRVAAGTSLYASLTDISEGGPCEGGSQEMELGP